MSGQPRNKGPQGPGTSLVDWRQADSRNAIGPHKALVLNKDHVRFHSRDSIISLLYRVGSVDPNRPTPSVHDITTGDTRHDGRDIQVQRMFNDNSTKQKPAMLSKAEPIQ